MGEKSARALLPSGRIPARRSRFLREREARVGFEFFVEFGPTPGDLHVEAMEVDGEELRIEDVDQAVDRGGEALGIELLREVADDRAFAVVWDSHAVAEHREERLLAGHQVGLEQVLADGVAGLEFESFMNPCVLLGHGFFLHKDRAELAVVGKGGDGGLVDIPVVGAEPIEDLSDNGRIDGGVKFVGFHGGNGMGAKSMRSRGGWQGRRSEKAR